MIYRRLSFPSEEYPINLDVPQDTLSLGELLNKFLQTGVLDAPTHDSAFQYESDENGNPIIQEGESPFPDSIDKLSEGLSYHEALNPKPEKPSPEVESDESKE